MSRPSAFPPVVILCGGRGRRLQEQTEMISKPLVEIGGMLILWHIMKIYGHFGFRNVVLCLGYKGDSINRFFMQWRSWMQGNCVLEFRDGEGRVASEVNARDGWRITFVDTGEETNTGGRLKRVEPYNQTSRFFATYVDVLADIDLAQLPEFHRSKGTVGTMTCVKPRFQFGIVEVDDDDRIPRYDEKPVMDKWVSGGFFVFDRRIFSHLGEDDVLEREPFERLARDRQFSAYKFKGFWACMDTYKDTQMLNELWEANRAPWKVWT